MPSTVDAGSFREKLIIAPQRGLLTAFLIIVIGLPGLVLPVAFAFAGRADWGGAIACSALFGALIAVIAHRAWAHTATIEIFERGLVVRRRGTSELLPFTSLSVSAQTYNSWLTNKPAAVRYRIEMAGRRPIFVQENQDNATAVARLIDLIPQRDLSTPLLSAELLLSRMRRTVISYAAGVVLFLACGSAGVAISLLRWNRGDPAIEAMVSTMLAFCFFCGAFILGAKARHLFGGRSSRLYRELMINQDGIAWAYVEGEVGPLNGEINDRLRSGTVHFYFHDRSSTSLDLSLEGAHQLLALVAARVPSAMLGHSDEHVTAWAERGRS